MSRYDDADRYAHGTGPAPHSWEESRDPGDPVISALGRSARYLRDRSQVATDETAAEQPDEQDLWEP